MSDSRERFEAWRIAHNPFGIGRSTEPGYTDNYDSPFTQQQWETWQAAESAAVRRCAQIAELACNNFVTAKNIKAEFPEAFK